VLVAGAALQALLVRETSLQGAWLAFLGVPALAAGVTALPTAAVAVARRGERSPVVVLVGVIGLFIWFLLIGELAHSH